MEDEAGAAAAAGSVSSASAAAATAPASARPSDWRPAIRHDYEASTVSAQRPIAARRFDPLTPQQYKQQYAQRTAHFERGVPIVFDNGTYELRAGFSTDADPRLSFRSLVGRPRNRKDADFVMVGNQLIEGDQYAPQRIKVRSPFEQTLLTQFDLMEYLFDYSFHALGLTDSVPHPVFVTEPLCQPNYCRSKTSELLFECYSVEGVSYGTAEMTAWSYNAQEGEGRSEQLDGDCTGDALVVSCGYESSTVLPVQESRPMFEHSSRLSVGGNHLSTHLTHALLHVHYPQHQQQLNAHRVQQLVEQYCEVAPERFSDTLERMALLYDVNGHTVPDGVPGSANVPPPVVLQLPFTPAESSTAGGAAAALSEAAAKHEKREQMRARLRAQMDVRRVKKLAEDQETLADWERVRADFHAKLMTPSEFLRQLKRRTFADEADFAMHLDKMRKSIEARLRGEGAEEAAANEAAALAAANAKKSEQELYPLLFRPDAELTPDELKEKQKQKRLKGSAEQQAQRRREKEARQQAEKQRADMEAAEYAADPQAFVASLYRTRENILAAREERLKAEADGSQQGRRSAAAKKRASLLAAMGGSGGSIELIEKNARKDRAAFQREAAFGMRDEDWKVYEDVRLPGDSGGGAGGDSEDEREALSKIESKLSQFDPAGLMALRSESSPAAKTAADFQVALWVDRVRLPEMLFEPAALLGIDEAGLAEMLSRTLARLDPAYAARAVQNVLLVGGSTLFPNFRERVEYELRQLRPVGTPLRVRMARDAQWDAWRGAAQLCNRSPFSQLFFTRAEWEEQGPEYLKEHSHANRLAQVQPQPEDGADTGKRRKRI